MRVRRIWMHERRNMAHISNRPFCFWVLRFPLFSSLFLQKPKPTRVSSLLLPCPFLSLRSFPFFADPHRSWLSRRTESIAFFSRSESSDLIDSHRFSRFSVGFLRFQDLDEEAGYDDYYSDDDGLEQEYEDEEEEEEEPPKEELEYLELRQKIKDSIRKNMGKGIANPQSSQQKRRKLPYNDFGSFFGPSRPVISSRKKRPVPTSGSGTKDVSHEKRPKVVNQVRRKVETLKDTRDYSFLFSDDAELPVPKKEPLSRSGSFPSSEARSAQISARPKQSSGINGRTAQGLPREEKRPVSANGHSRPASSGSQMNGSRPASSLSQMNGSRPASSGSKLSSRSVSGRPASSGSQTQNSRPASSGSQLNSRSVSGRPISSGSQTQNSRPASSGSQMQQRAASSVSQRPGSSTSRQAPTRPPSSLMNGQSANRNGQPNSRLDPHRSAPAKMSVDQRKQMGSSNGVGPGRSAPTSRPLPSKMSLERKPSISAGKSSLQSAQRPSSSSRPMSSDPRQRMLEQRKVSRDPTSSRLIPKQSAPTSKHQMMSKLAPKRPPPRDIDDVRRPLKKKKPARLSEDDIAMNMIRSMFKTDRFAGRDDDDRNMEANFDDIMKEERRSARIAREEDEREAMLEEEEERRKRERKRKLSR
ncbi:hypothetical protein EUTSA_v10000080mg [Eutrema salsugineum]|uniref:SPT2 chromatin protein n=1 Tax=Eutrema salsugineum TaxID=72664 RepID=V4M1U6_EUTSA|nr:hypothetical protein EUTSA_v10000080mg [Eutrema salsugineum]